MRLSTRFVAPLLALVAFAAPATVPAAHAAQGPVIAHSIVSDTYTPAVVVARPGDIITVTNTSGALTYKFFHATTRAQVGQPSTPSMTIPNGQDLVVPSVPSGTQLDISTAPPSSTTPGFGFARVIVI